MGARTELLRRAATTRTAPSVTATMATITRGVESEPVNARLAAALADAVVTVVAPVVGVTTVVGVTGGWVVGVTGGCVVGVTGIVVVTGG